ncbi:MAG: formylglycine-generating enzyme family protein [Kiritimatiellae bacterium]|nr:formylglycine-generating enzyme family protein [Kiritimatiellia bacterium]
MTYTEKGRCYEGIFAAVNVDWQGPKTIPVSLKEYTRGDTKTLKLPGGATMEMIYVAPGSFTMGSENGENDEESVHTVRITKGYWLGKYEVTQAQWRSVMGGNPSYFTGDDRNPVEQVSWDDCQTFIEKVNAQLHCGARLPTESEWEYVCRAGTRGAYAKEGTDAYTSEHPAAEAALEEMGWYNGNSGGRTHPVGQKAANPWGFHDMHGNVWEWCADWYGDYPSGSVTDPTGPASGSYRVQRGGSWNYVAQYCRSASRNYYGPSLNYGNYGFRLCCSAGLQ